MNRIPNAIAIQTMAQAIAGIPVALAMFTASVGTDVPHFLQEAPGMSVFARSDGVVYHTYSAYARGLDALWGIYQWLDRAPRGRNEGEPPQPWMRRHDEYGGAVTRDGGRTLG